MARMTYARNLAKKLLTDHLVHVAPTPLDDIVKNNHIEITEREFPENSTIDALLIKKGGNATIVVNKSHSSNRKRFSIAHELGHCLMHTQDELYVDKDVLERTFIFTRSTEKRDDEEKEANLFAAELLMPSALIKKDFLRLIEQREENIFSKLADDYKVSETALTYKLMNLNLL